LARGYLINLDGVAMKTYVKRACAALGWQAGQIVTNHRMIEWLRRAALSNDP